MAHAADRIRRLGYVAPDERADLLAGAAAFAYPSMYEGFGFPPLEAMAAGVPVVAAAAGALPEVLGDAALLVDPRDVDDLSGALERVRDDNDLRARLVARAHARAGRYRWEITVEQVAELYRSLL